MKLRVSMAFASAMLATLVIYAAGGQGPGAPPTAAQMVAQRVAHLTTLLSLNSDQQAKATTLFTTEETALSAIHGSMRTARTALNAAVEANDANGIASAAAEIGTLTTQEVQGQATADAAFYAILSNDQQTKYKAMPFGHGGPGGGPRGPGGPAGEPPN